MKKLELEKILKNLQDGDEVWFTPYEMDEAVEGIFVEIEDRKYIAIDNPVYDGVHGVAAKKAGKRYAWMIYNEYTLWSEIGYLVPKNKVDSINKQLLFSF